MSSTLDTLNPEKARESIQRADLLLKTGQLPRALDELRNCLQVYQPDNVDAHLMAARVYLRAGQARSAERVLTDLHHFHPPSPESLTLRAEAEFHLQKYQDAEKSLEEVFMARRDFLPALEVMGHLRLKTNRTTEALTVFERLHESQPANPSILTALARAHFQAKQYEDAIFYCAELQDAGTNSPQVDALYRDALREKKQHELSKRKNVSFLTKLWWTAFDPIGEKALRIQSAHERTEKRSRRKTMTCPKTGALNSEASRTYIPTILARAKKSVFLCHTDVDYFKGFNDCHSHPVGDAVLVALARAGKKFFPDSFFRQGGEEFIWVLEGELEDALSKAIEFRKYCEENLTKEANAEIERKDIRNPSGGLFFIHYPITLSQGLVQAGEDGTTFELLHQAADLSCYAAKDAGRNAVVFRGEVKDRGTPPIKYTKALLKILDGLALESKLPSWWAYQETLEEANRKKVLEKAQNLERGQ